MENISESDVRILEVLHKQGIVEVSKVQKYSNSEILCMKKLHVGSLLEANPINREILAFALLEHENIIKIRSVFISGSVTEVAVVVLMDFYPDGDLQKFIESRAKPRQFLTEEEILDYLQQLVSTCAYLQERDLAHNKIKPQNIFISSSNNRRIIKLGDPRSTAKRDATMMVNIVATPLYLSPLLRRYFNSGDPEFYRSAHNVYKSDVYSLGAIFLYLASLNPIKELCNLDNLEGKIKGRIDSLPEMYPRIKYLLESMLKVDEELRPDFIQLKNLLGRVIVSDKSDQATSLLTEGSEQISPIFYKCGICNKYQLKDEFYILTSGVFCKSCYNNSRGAFYPKTL